MVFPFELKMKKDVSNLEFLKPHCIKATLNLSNHALGAYFNQYKA